MVRSKNISDVLLSLLYNLRRNCRDFFKVVVQAIEYEDLVFFQNLQAGEWHSQKPTEFHFHSTPFLLIQSWDFALIFGLCKMNITL